MAWTSTCACATLPPRASPWARRAQDRHVRHRCRGSCAEKPKSSGQPNGLSNAERQKLRREVSSLERKMETQRTRVEEAEQQWPKSIPPTTRRSASSRQKIDEAHAAMDELEMAWLEASEKLEGEE